MKKFKLPKNKYALIDNSDFEKIWIPVAPSDAGSCVGACIHYLVQNKKLKKLVMGWRGRGLAVGGHRGLRCTIILVTGAKGHRAIPQCPYVPLAHRSGKRVHLCQAHRRIAERPGETICRAHLPSDLRHSSHLAHTALRRESGRCRLCFEM